MKVSTVLVTVFQAVLVFGLAGTLLAQSSETLSVTAFMDIWQSGGYNDGSNGLPPVAYAFPAAPGQTLTFSSVTGTWSCGNDATPNGPDGTPEPWPFPGRRWLPARSPARDEQR